MTILFEVENEQHTRPLVLRIEGSSPPNGIHEMISLSDGVSPVAKMVSSP